MGQIMELARSLSGSRSTDGENKPPSSEPRQPSPAPAGDLSSLFTGGLDPRILEVASRFLANYRSEDDDRAALLNALRPFVREARYARLDQAIRLSRMTRAVRIALDTFKDGREHHV